MEIKHVVHPTGIFSRIDLAEASQLTIGHGDLLVRLHTDHTLLAHRHFHRPLRQHHVGGRLVVAADIELRTQHLHAQSVGMNDKRMAGVVGYLEVSLTLDCHLTLRTDELTGIGQRGVGIGGNTGAVAQYDGELIAHRHLEGLQLLGLSHNLLRPRHALQHL